MQTRKSWGGSCTGPSERIWSEVKAVRIGQWIGWGDHQSVLWAPGFLRDMKTTQADTSFIELQPFNAPGSCGQQSPMASHWEMSPNKPIPRSLFLLKHCGVFPTLSVWESERKAAATHRAF